MGSFHFLSICDCVYKFNKNKTKVQLGLFVCIKHIEIHGLMGSTKEKMVKDIGPLKENHNS